MSAIDELGFKKKKKLQRMCCFVTWYHYMCNVLIYVNTTVYTFFFVSNILKDFINDK